MHDQELNTKQEQIQSEPQPQEEVQEDRQDPEDYEITSEEKEQDPVEISDEQQAEEDPPTLTRSAWAPVPRETLKPSFMGKTYESSHLAMQSNTPDLEYDQAEAIVLAHIFVQTYSLKKVI